MEKDRTTIKDSIGTIVGDHNKQDIKIVQTPNEEKPFDLPIDNKLNGFVTFGRWFWNKHGARKFYVVTTIPVILFLLFFSGVMFYVSYTTKSGQIGISPIQNLIIYLFVGAAIISPLGTLLYLSRTRTCQECKKRFAYKDHKPIKHLSRNEYKGQIIHNLKQFLKCDFCGHELEHDFSEVEEKEQTNYSL